MADEEIKEQGHAEGGGPAERAASEAQKAASAAQAAAKAQEVAAGAQVSAALSQKNAAEAQEAAAKAQQTAYELKESAPKSPISGWQSLIIPIAILLGFLLLFFGATPVLPEAWRSWVSLGLIVLFLILEGLILLPFLGITNMSDSLANQIRRATTSNAFAVNLMLIGLILLTGILSGLGIYQNLNTPEVLIGLYIVLGVSVLLTLLLIMAQAFKWLDLTMPGQPLGLPTGSIRAMIALILLLIFILMGIYLFRMVSFPQSAGGTLQGLTKEEVLSLGSRAVGVTPEPTDAPSVQTYTVIVKDPDGALHGLTKEEADGLGSRAVGVTPEPTAVPAAQTFTVRVANVVSDNGAQLAQQILTMIGTLVVAVSGFYFGSRAMEEARPEQKDDSAGNPLIESITPTESKPVAKVALTIRGKNLLSPKSVRLTFEKDATTHEQDVIAASILKVSATEIQCQVNLENKTPEAKYDVTMINYNDESSTLVKALTITEAA